MASAQTGTGKTAAFTLPILEKLSKTGPVKERQARVLILTPTRELAAQIGESVTTYGKYLSLSSAVVFGGVKVNPQITKLRKGVDVLVATPGRLLDLYNQHAVRFHSLEVLVLDEADRMLDMGFIRDIKKILAFLPRERQNLMFSATFSKEIRNLASGLVQDPVEVSVSVRNTAAETIEHWIHPVDKKHKTDLLIHLIKENDWQQVLVFSRTKHGANKITRKLEIAGINAAAIHGNKSQGARTKALKNFKDGTVKILVATDIAARGIDIDQLPHVVNFDLPNVPQDYVHRIGRTGRAGINGQAISLVCADEADDLRGIERLLKMSLESKLVEGFKPSNSIPEARVEHRHNKYKKPHNPKPSHRDGQRSGQNSQGNRPADKKASGSKIKRSYFSR